MEICFVKKKQIKFKTYQNVFKYIENNNFANNLLIEQKIKIIFMNYANFVGTYGHFALFCCMLRSIEKWRLPF